MYPLTENCREAITILLSRLSLSLSLLSLLLLVLLLLLKRLLLLVVMKLLPPWGPPHPGHRS